LLCTSLPVFTLQKKKKKMLEEERKIE